jgi:hypothetical protein
MFWHKFRLDWSYALGELLIVTLGVLIALAVNNWNNERLERAQERDVVARLIADIEDDLRRFDFQLKAIERKEQSLRRLRTAFANGGPEDAAEFLNDVVRGANFGWNQMSPNRATFDGLLDSGRLALIEDAGVRALIAEYYRSGEQALNRIDERETAYPALSYQLVPRGPATVTARGADDVTLQPGLDDDALNKLVTNVQRSPLEGHLIAEINLARFIRGITEYLRIQGSDLLVGLKEYQNKIA